MRAGIKKNIPFLRGEEQVKARSKTTKEGKKQQPIRNLERRGRRDNGGGALKFGRNLHQRI